MCFIVFFYVMFVMSYFFILKPAIIKNVWYSVRRIYVSGLCLTLTVSFLPLQGHAACALLILDKMEDSALSLSNTSLQTYVQTVSYLIKIHVCWLFTLDQL